MEDDGSPPPHPPSPSPRPPPPPPHAFTKSPLLRLSATANASTWSGARRRSRGSSLPDPEVIDHPVGGLFDDEFPAAPLPGTVIRFRSTGIVVHQPGLAPIRA